MPHLLALETASGEIRVSLHTAGSLVATHVVPAGTLEPLITRAEVPPAITPEALGEEIQGNLAGDQGYHGATLLAAAYPSPGMHATPPKMLRTTSIGPQTPQRVF